MKTKLFPIILILMLIYPQLFSQKRPKPDTGIHLGVVAGATIQNLYGKDFWGEKLDNKFIIGYQAGVNVNIPIVPDFYLQPGLLFSSAGAKQKIIESPSKSDGNEVTNTIRINYLEIPLTFLFRPQVGDGHLLLGIGPYAGYGLFGKARTKEGSSSSDIDIKFRNKVTPSDPSGYAYFRPFDAGGALLFGYEMYSGLFLQLNGQLGLMKVNPQYESLTNNKTSIKNWGFGISAGFRF